jgi:hypothetical protein
MARLALALPRVCPAPIELLRRRMGEGRQDVVLNTLQVSRLPCPIFSSKGSRASSAVPLRPCLFSRRSTLALHPQRVSHHMPLGLCAQIACLLANGFFCTFPVRPVRRSPPLAPLAARPATRHPLHSPSLREGGTRRVRLVRGEGRGVSD